MRLMIVSAFPPNPAPEANHAFHLSEQLAQAGVEVHVVCEIGSVPSPHPSIIIHPIIRRWSWSDLPRILKCLQKTRPDGVLIIYVRWIFNGFRMISLIPALCRLPGWRVPCVTQFENADSFPPLLTRYSTQLVLLSGPHRDALLRRTPALRPKTVIIPPPPLIRMPSESPAAVRQRVRESMGLRSEDFLVLYIGYIYPGKGIETLLRAFKVLRDQDPTVRLAIVGGTLEITNHSIPSSTYLGSLKRIEAALGLEQAVMWSGSFKWDDSGGPSYLHAGDLCVLPFDFGVTLNNSTLAAAAACGLPIVATELPLGADDALEHGRNVYLCPSQDPMALARAMQLLRRSGVARGKLSSGSLALARQWYRWEETVKRLLRLFPGSQAMTRRAPTPKLPEGPGNLNRKGVSERRSNQVPESPLVSVIVAVYNVEHYLSQCLDALVSQSMPEIEIIVVDDASTDNSLVIAQKYCATYDRIRLLCCAENRGLASVRNIGLNAARGDYIAFADGDDWVDIQMCARLHQRAVDVNADVVIGDTVVFYHDTKRSIPFFDAKLRESLLNRVQNLPFTVDMEPEVLLLEPVAWTKLYRRAYLELENIAFEEGMNSYEDMIFHFSALVGATRIAIVDSVGCFYRQNRPGQISGNVSRRMFEVFRIFDLIQGVLDSRNVSAKIWGLFLKVQLRQFRWLLQDRVQREFRSEFIGLVWKQLRKLPPAAMGAFVQVAMGDDAALALCLRKNFRWGFASVLQRQLPLYPLLYGVANRHIGPRPLAAWLVRNSLRRPLMGRLLQHVRASPETKLETRPIGKGAPGALRPMTIGKQIFFFSDPGDVQGVSASMLHAQDDYYLTRSAVLRPGDSVIDIGAHVGVFAITLAKLHPYITVYAVEPNSRSFDCLRRNVASNGAHNVIAIQKAVSGVAGRRNLYSSPADSSWATLQPSYACTQAFVDREEVDVVTLDLLFDQQGLSYCRLLKLSALGEIANVLGTFTKAGAVDFLTGEADADDCDGRQLELLSSSVARHHFWRVTAGILGESLLHRLPAGPPCEVY